ncbi:MAG: aliphatic sulfonate ABC transporter substrate-binding protein [Lachnospiraceae bacterium]|nr:aliphatic sulfonate ABC transporter substrate-binding protein [Lachnospiraceae bacterium]
MKKRIFGMALAVVLGLGALTACGGKEAPTEAEKTDQTIEEKQTEEATEANDSTDSEAKEADTSEGKVLRVAAQSYPLYSPINAAYELGYFDEEFKNIGATFTWTGFASGPLVNEAVAAGEADVGFMADLPAIIARSSGQDIQVVSGVSTGERSLAVLVGADSDIADIKDLKGKKVAYAFGSYAQHLLALVLDQAGLTFDDVESVNLGAADSPQALANKDVDAIVIWEQFITKLTNDGTAKVLIDGTGIKKSNMVLYAVKEFAAANPELIEAFIKATNRGAEYIKSNPKEAAALLAPVYNVTEEEMEKIFGNFNFSVALSDDDIAEITKVADYAHEAGIIANPVNGDEFINTDYLKEAGF